MSSSASCWPPSGGPWCDRIIQGLTPLTASRTASLGASKCYAHGERFSRPHFEGNSKGTALDCFKDCVLKERLSRPHFFCLAGVTLRIGRMAGSLSLRLLSQTKLRAILFAKSAPLQAPLCAYPPRFEKKRCRTAKEKRFLALQCSLLLTGAPKQDTPYPLCRCR